MPHRNLATLLLPAFLFLGSLPCHGEEEGEWIEFESAEGGYRTIFPEEPKALESESPGADGNKVKYHYQMYGRGKEGYAVVHLDLTTNFANEEEIAEGLAAGRDACVAQFKGELEVDSVWPFEGNLGRAFIIKMGDGGYYRSRILLVDRRLYQIIRVGTKVSVSSEESNCFFAAFELLPKAD